MGAAAAGAIAVINSVGNLAGFVAPYMIGFLKTKTDSLAAGLYFVAMLELLAVVLVLIFIKLPSHSCVSKIIDYDINPHGDIVMRIFYG